MCLTMVFLVLLELLLVFGNDKLIVWQAIWFTSLTTMGSNKITILQNSCKPIYVLPHHVCCIYGVKMANMICGKRSIWNMYSITESFDAVGPVKKSMPQGALQDLKSCMHLQSLSVNIVRSTWFCAASTKYKRKSTIFLKNSHMHRASHWPPRKKICMITKVPQ